MHTLQGYTFLHSLPDHSYKNTDHFNEWHNVSCALAVHRPTKNCFKGVFCSNLLSYSFLQDLLITSFWNLSRVSFFSISLNVHGSAEYSFESSECQQLAASRPDFTRIIRTSSLSSKKNGYHYNDYYSAQKCRDILSGFSIVLKSACLNKK